jgi:hypothetical protein
VDQCQTSTGMNPQLSAVIKSLHLNPAQEAYDKIPTEQGKRQSMDAVVSAGQRLCAAMLTEPAAVENLAFELQQKSTLLVADHQNLQRRFDKLMYEYLRMALVPRCSLGYDGPSDGEMSKLRIMCEALRLDQQDFFANKIPVNRCFERLNAARDLGVIGPLQFQVYGDMLRRAAKGD